MPHGSPALGALLYGQEPDPDLSIVPLTETVDRPERFAGTYLAGSDFFQPNLPIRVTAAPDHLVMHWTSGLQAPLIPCTATEFIDRMFWARVRFAEEEAGRITEMVWIYDEREFRARRIARDGSSRPYHHRGALDAFR